VTRNFASELIVSACFFRNEGLESATSKQNRLSAESKILPEEISNFGVSSEFREKSRIAEAGDLL
jgi:hypothetical protein